MPEYNSLDDALTLIGFLVTAPEDVRDEEVVSLIDAESVEDLQDLVVVLAGIASGLALSISDEKSEDGGEALRRLGATRDEVEG